MTPLSGIKNHLISESVNPLHCLSMQRTFLYFKNAGLNTTQRWGCLDQRLGYVPEGWVKHLTQLLVWKQPSMCSVQYLPSTGLFLTQHFLECICTFSLLLSFSALLCVWAEFPAPVIKLNSFPLNQSEVVWSANTPFILSCEGQADIVWKTRLWKHQKHLLRKTLNVQNPTADYTGTYRCSYKSQKDLYSEIHIYVKGMCSIKH